MLPTCAKENEVHFIAHNSQQNTMNFHLKGYATTCSKEKKVNFFVHNILQNTLNFHVRVQDSVLRQKTNLEVRKRLCYQRVRKKTKYTFSSIIYNKVL